MLAGGAGDDRLDGGAGIDTASYLSALTGVAVLLDRTSAQNTRGAGTDRLSGFENLAGSNFADKLIGDALGNVLDGNGGDDELDGGGGADAMRGGAGNDTYFADTRATP